MRTRVGLKTRPSTHPEIIGILGDLAGPYVKGVSPNCKNLINLGWLDIFGRSSGSPIRGGAGSRGCARCPDPSERPRPGSTLVLWCPGPESNRYVSFETRDFKSRASASFATRAGQGSD
jgi:hypothetical protein